MKIVAISDTHNKQDKIVIPPCDLLIHCGDFSLHGSLVELNTFNEWLKLQPAKNIVVVPGNHDFICEELPVLCRQTLTTGKFLIDEFIEIEGLKIYGSPWVPQYGRWAFMDSRKELEKKWELIPTGLDILITHGPPRQVLDKTTRGEFAGCTALRDRLKIVKPKVHMFGHIHESYGEYTDLNPALKDIRFLNVATCDAEYIPNHKPVEIEW